MSWYVTHEFSILHIRSTKYWHLEKIASQNIF